ncbi:hypothetical protein CMsap09_01080 [Clavibacter michiganensis]|uniref:Uncharacterized protein n=1 Tax=Clavibacter michiganensis TaxID=28447 RepID=A0A251XPW0_9MICO|nr:hypothetical protein CMsap09_01080 [Clavibacter michiganensis]
MIVMSDQMAMSGLASQSCWRSASPMFARKPLRAPEPWSMRLQPVPTTTSEMTYGTKISTRMIDWPRSFRFSSSATRIATGPCSTSDSTTITALCISASWNVGSWRIVM